MLKKLYAVLVLFVFAQASFAAWDGTGKIPKTVTIGDTLYYEITSPEELETAIRYGPLKEQEAETWRQNYGSYFFEKRDLIVFQIGYGQQWDMVLLRAETAGDELRVILQKKSARSFGIMREILFVELPKDTLEGISSFSLRITGMN